MRRAAALVGALALALAAAAPGPVAAQAQAGDRHPVVLAEGGRLYAAWNEAGGATPGALGLLRGPAGEPLDTVEVAWTRDAIAALVPRHGVAALAGFDSLSVATAGLWVEELPSARGEPAGTLRVPLSALPQTLDPARVTSLAEKQVVTQIFEGLVRLGPRLEPLPAAADSFHQEGGRWRFHLRPDGRFHNGRPVRADDVVTTLERALAPAFRAPRVDGLADAIVGAAAYRNGRASHIAGLRVLDSLDVEIVVTRERAPLLSELASPAAFLVPVEATDSTGALFGQAPVGSGPFRFVARDSGGVTVSAAAGRTAGVDTVEFRRVAGPAEAVFDFELGRLDLVAAPETEERRILTRGRLQPDVLTVDEASTYYVGMNVRSRFLADREHRRALAGSIDRALAVRVLVPGRGRLARGILPPVFGVGTLDDDEWLEPADDAQARARAVAPQAPALSFWTPAGSEAGLRVAEFVSATLRRLGYRVTIETHPWDAYLRGVLDGRADLFYLSWFADGADPVAFVASLVESRRRGAGGNRTFYSSEPVDAALAEARAADTTAEQHVALREAERLALSDAPLVPLFHSVNVTLVRPGVSGLVLDPLGAPRYDAVEVRRGE